MSVLLSLNKKKGLSNIVAYVLLIAITISLSVIVYGWLRFYVSPEDVDTCSEDVNIIIKSYECFENSRLSITLKNKGLFTVDGYTLRVHDREGADFGFYLFDDKGVRLLPGDEYTKTYSFKDYLQGDEKYELKTVTFVDVQPFINESGKVSCKSYSSQDILCK